MPGCSSAPTNCARCWQQRINVGDKTICTFSFPRESIQAGEMDAILTDACAQAEPLDCSVGLLTCYKINTKQPGATVKKDFRLPMEHESIVVPRVKCF